MTPFQPSSFAKNSLAGVLGMGRSGQAISKLLAKKGFRVLGSDTRPRARLKLELARMPKAVSWESGRHSARLMKCAFVVKSPGLKHDLPILTKLANAGIPIYSELEVAAAFTHGATLIAITGTNGKSTTTTLTWEIFKNGLPRLQKALLAGNIGIPLSTLALSAKHEDVLVCETSSYQLEDSTSIAPHVAAILNITPDHLEHHGSMAKYIEAKAKVFRHQSGDDYCIFNADDPIVYKLSRECRSHRLYFGSKASHVHAWQEGKRLHFKLPGWKKPISLLPPRLPGSHNIENALASALIAFAAGIKSRAVQRAFTHFKGVEHRLESCGLARGIACVNDSKATNVDSTLVALKSFANQGKRVLLILGGEHKGSPYSPLRPYIESGVKAILTIGAAAGIIESDLNGSTAIFPCENLPTAVSTGLQIGSKGDILLLSPACASFDQFTNFEHRGRCFKTLVAEAKS